MAIHTGDRNNRITLQCKTKVPDGLGSFVDTWIDKATVWAKKRTLRSDEARIAMVTTGTAIHVFNINYRSDIKPSWRIKEGDRYYSIVGQPVEVWLHSDHMLDITAKESTV
jgi:SPP1 family predicted phage head-tail adaptor